MFALQCNKQEANAKMQNYQAPTLALTNQEEHAVIHQLFGKLEIFIFCMYRKVEHSNGAWVPNELRSLVLHLLHAKYQQEYDMLDMLRVKWSYSYYEHGSARLLARRVRNRNQCSLAMIKWLSVIKVIIPCHVLYVKNVGKRLSKINKLVALYNDDVEVVLQLLMVKIDILLQLGSIEYAKEAVEFALQMVPPEEERYAWVVQELLCTSELLNATMIESLISNLEAQPFSWQGTPFLSNLPNE